MSKKLGQHFLIARSKIQKIVEALELGTGDMVIEIGPGHGELTSNIKNQKSKIKIIAIEKDKKLAAFLKEKFGGYKNIKIIEGDALKILPKLIKTDAPLYESYKIAGNIPYYITGRLFRVLSELKNKPALIVLTVQKEVAEKMCARPPKMNLLAASVQIWAEPKIICIIAKRFFRPPPRVDGAIIKLKVGKERLEMRENYYRFVRMLFKQPRKTILNNLIGADKRGLARMGKEKIIAQLLKLGIGPNGRPQDLNVKQIIELSKIFCNLISKI